MRPQRFSIHHLLILAVVILLSTGLATLAVAQSQEPKPDLPATPVASPASPVSDGATTGVSGSSWQGPNFGVGYAGTQPSGRSKASSSTRNTMGCRSARPSRPSTSRPTTVSAATPRPALRRPNRRSANARASRRSSRSLDRPLPVAD